MDTITHREMRNSSAEVLRRVENGESLLVTNNGVPTAVIGPVGDTVLDGLIARGEARPAQADASTLSALRRRLTERGAAARSSAEMIRDARGQW